MVRTRKSLPPLTPRGRETPSIILNAVAFNTHGEVGDVAALAKELGTTAGRLRPMLRKLETMGYLTIEGRLAERVLPTVALSGGRVLRLPNGKRRHYYKSSARSAYLSAALAQM